MNLMKRLHLVFGCIDMIRTHDGQYVFLEINPSGQWGWIEQFTGLPITKALASLLAKGGTVNGKML
jgi:glutathione synthase/RimK-type ligase-like ATP-grasp enzyme